MPKSKIHILYTENKKPLQEDNLRKMYGLIPLKLRSHIDKHKRWQDKQASLLGKLLLANWAKTNLNDENILHKISIDKKGRPNLQLEIDFNISHSKDIVVCAINLDGPIGVDIEKISPIEIEDFKKYFSLAETKLITGNNFPLTTFFDIWTKKEAIIKAIGRGFPQQLDKLDTSVLPTLWEGNRWFTKGIFISSDYSCHIATLNELPLLQINQFLFN